MSPKYFIMAIIVLLLGSVTKWVLGQRSVVEGMDFMTHITNWKNNLSWLCLLLHCATLGCEEHSVQGSHRLMNSVGEKSRLSGLGFMSFRDSLCYSGSRCWSEYSTAFFPNCKEFHHPDFVTDSFSFIFSPVLCAYYMTCHRQWVRFLLVWTKNCVLYWWDLCGWRVINIWNELHAYLQ